MTISRRAFLGYTAVASALSSAIASAMPSSRDKQSPPVEHQVAQTDITTPNGITMHGELENGIRVFRLTAEPVEREFAPGMTVKCWGYNGLTPGPTLVATEGETVRIYVTNRLPEHTTIHWHGILLPNGMDGVGGLNQPHIKPGETYQYEFKLRQHGTFMYHPHADEVTQLALGMMGMFVVHPKHETRPVDRDFAIMLHEWKIHPGTARPDPVAMFDFNTFTMNSRVFPAIDPLVANQGQRIRIRFGNLSMDQHPIHLHGHVFNVTATDGGRIRESAQWPETTVAVPVGSTREIEFVADVAGDWAFHCHRSHHTMNAMAHELPNMIGINMDRLKKAVAGDLPEFLPMGESGMAEHGEHLAHLSGPKNTLPMMLGDGPHGPMEMGGMFTVLKVRKELSSYEDPGWYPETPSNIASKVS